MRLAVVLVLCCTLAGCPGDHVRGVGLRTSSDQLNSVRSNLQAFSEAHNLSLQDAPTPGYPYPADYQGFKPVAFLTSKPQALEASEHVVSVELSEARGAVSVSISRLELAGPVCQSLHDAGIPFRIDHDHERNPVCAKHAQP